MASYPLMQLQDDMDSVADWAKETARKLLWPKDAIKKKIFNSTERKHGHFEYKRTDKA